MLKYTHLEHALWLGKVVTMEHFHVCLCMREKGGGHVIHSLECLHTSAHTVGGGAVWSCDHHVTFWTHLEALKQTSPGDRRPIDLLDNKVLGS